MGNQIQTEATIYVRFDIKAKQHHQIEIKKLQRPNNHTNKHCTLELQATYFQK